LCVDYRAGNGARPDDGIYVPTYYPSVIDAASATPIQVLAGGEISNVNVRLSPVRTVRIRGRVAGPAVSDKGSLISISLAPRLASQQLAGNRGAPVDPQGAFEIAGVPPGAYTLTTRVMVQIKGPSYSAYSVPQAINVGNANIDDLVVMVPPPLVVSGRIRVEGTVPAPLKRLRVSLSSSDRSSAGGAEVDDDLTFKIENVSPNQYFVYVSPLPDGYYLKTVRAGGAGGLNSGLDLTGGAAPFVDILLSPNAGRVAGTVQSDDAKHLAGGTQVALIPQEKERRDRYVQSTRAGEDGRFAFSSVPPGEYRLFAWEELEINAVLDPEFVGSQESKGQPVTVREGDKLNVHVKLILTETGSR
jgi:hypothetical protein